MLRQAIRTGTVNGERKTGSLARGKIATAGSVVVGCLVGLDDAGAPLVDYPGNRQSSLPARSTVPLSQQQVGREVALMFEEGDPARPLIIGLIQDPFRPTAEAKLIHTTVDGEPLTITAEKELVLKCGQASIVLTRDGKIQLRGTYLLSRSSGVNRIQGGSIELN